SALPGEGKSLTATELAHSFARAGRRVVLVNADMRRPSSLMQTTKTSEPGLAEVLSGDIRVEDALMPTETPNLSMLHGGNATQNPIDLISQPLMAGTMQSLREAADVVIVDSPPAGVVADALLIAPHVDCVLYVVGVGIVNSESMRNTAGALAAAAPKMLAYFVNRVPHLGGEPANYSYAGYGRTTFAPPSAVPESSPRGYQSTRTIVMKRYADTDRTAQTPEPRNGSGLKPLFSPDQPAESATEARSSLRVLPKVGSALKTVDGPYLGQSFALSSSKTLTLGTRSDSDIVLARDETISQVHAHIALEDSKFVIYDVSSTNGTLVNNIPVSRHALEIGDVLQLGASKFRYE
ncbi:MAG: FHA domain-containing protein, partial [Janthinobacterium lividum]